MPFYPDLIAVGNAIMDFRANHIESVPEALRDEFRDLTANPVPGLQVPLLGEFIYAHRAELPPEALGLGIGLISFCTAVCWHGLAENERGQKIVFALNRDAGQPAFPGYPAPAPEDDPEPLPQFVPPPPQPDQMWEGAPEPVTEAAEAAPAEPAVE